MVQPVATSNGMIEIMSCNFRFARFLFLSTSHQCTEKTPTMSKKRYMWGATPTYTGPALAVDFFPWIHLNQTIEKRRSECSSGSTGISLRRLPKPRFQMPIQTGGFIPRSKRMIGWSVPKTLKRENTYLESSLVSKPQLFCGLPRPQSWYVWIDREKPPQPPRSPAQRR
jgi:hypothetical protein